MIVTAQVYDSCEPVIRSVTVVLSNFQGRFKSKDTIQERIYLLTQVMWAASRKLVEEEESNSNNASDIKIFRTHRDLGAV